MTAEGVTMAATTKEAIVVAEAEEAIEDKDKSIHRSSSDNNKDEGSDSDFRSVSTAIPAASPTAILTASPAAVPMRFWRNL